MYCISSRYCLCIFTCITSIGNGSCSEARTHCPSERYVIRVLIEQGMLGKRQRRVCIRKTTARADDITEKHDVHNINQRGEARCVVGSA